MPKFLTNLTSGQLDALRQLSQSTDVPVSVYIRQAIDAYILYGITPYMALMSGQVVSGNALVGRG